MSNEIKNKYRLEMAENRILRGKIKLSVKTLKEIALGGMSEDDNNDKGNYLFRLRILAEQTLNELGELGD